jgi:hypothetical protein
VKILQLLGLWTVLSVPVSVFTGFLLHQGDVQPAPVRTTPR